jgi:hypothetical protein
MASTTTDLPTMPEPGEPPPGGGNVKKLVIAAVVALLVILGIKVLFAYWWRRGGPRRAITGLAEDGAVKLADALLDEVFPAA